jgi:hypothetical protein
VVPETVHCTTEAGANPLPFTVNWKADPPAVTLEGLMEVMVGAITVKFAGFEVAPPEVTVTGTVPGVVIRFAPTVAVT